MAVSNDSSDTRMR